MKINRKGFGAVGLLVVAAVIAALGAVGWFVYQRQNKTEEPKRADITNFEECKAAGNPIMESYPEQCAANGQTFTNESQKASVESPKEGTITGKASYPGEKLPDDLEICAEDIAGANKPICINVGKSQTINYKLTVPTGEYHVFSRTSKNEGYKAYYNEYVRCGVSVDCPATGHDQPIPVKVEEGATISGIDPGDWYNISN